MRAARIFITGVCGLFAVLFVATFARQAVIVFASGLFVLVAIGFSIPVRRWIPATGSSLDENDSGRAVINPFPKLVVFETELRKLWMLLLTPLYAMGVATVAYGRFDEKWGFGSEFAALPLFFSIKAGKWITVAAALMGWLWLRERLVLRKAEATEGFDVHKAGDHEVSYQYFDSEGERRSGLSYVFGPITQGFPVFMHAEKPDFSKPGFGFLFHRFREVDARNVPAEILRRAQKLLAARASVPSPNDAS